MKKIKTTLILVSAISSLYFLSCTSNTYSEVKTGAVANPTYSANIAPLMAASCTSCHGSNATFPPLTTYAEVKASTESTGNSNLICRVKGTSCGAIMPQNSAPFDAVTVKMIEDWKAQGYAQ